MTLYKGLSLEDIIQCFTDQKNDVDSKLLNIFLYTYRSYCKPWDIIQLIIKRFNHLNDETFGLDNGSAENNGFTNAVIIFFNMWLTIPFAYDFYELPDFESLNLLLKSSRGWPDTILFIKSSAKFKKSFKRLEEMIDNVLVSFNAMGICEQGDYPERAIDCQIRESFPFNNPSRENEFSKTLFDFSPEKIANSLSFIDQNVLRRLQLPELIKYTRKETATSVTQVINTYNQLYNIVKLSVLQPVVVTRVFDPYQRPDWGSSEFDDDSPSPGSTPTNSTTVIRDHQRYNVIEKWILTAQILHRLRNFSSLVAILTALYSTELKCCMNILKINKSSKLSNLYQSLLKTLEPYINQNKEEIPDFPSHLSEIPYLGIYLRSMTYINDAFPDFVKSSVRVYDGSNDELINIDKCRRQFDVMAQVKLFISSLNFNKTLKEDKAFSNWYYHMQIETRKSKRYSSDADLLCPEMSSEDLRTFSSNESLEKIENHKSISKSVRCVSHEHLNVTERRNRIESAPVDITKTMLSRNLSFDANLCNHSTEPKVATVKLKESRNNSTKSHIDILYKKKPQTVSSSTSNNRERPLLSNFTRSSTFVDVNLNTIQYKKIKIYEKDRTDDFVCRVLEKFGKSKLPSNEFNVFQILDNKKEIMIQSNQNLFYALAEKSDYLIEVRRKEIITS